MWNTRNCKYGGLKFSHNWTTIFNSAWSALNIMYDQGPLILSFSKKKTIQSRFPPFQFWIGLARIRLSLFCLFWNHRGDSGARYCTVQTPYRTAQYSTDYILMIRVSPWSRPRWFQKYTRRIFECAVWQKWRPGVSPSVGRQFSTANDLDLM